jgi:uncharacterized NAD(P)/FAD-binding protein YdhS
MHVAIIGNGFSGLMVARNLVDLGTSNLILSIFEKQHPPGQGIAYSPQSEQVLLNVVADKMSAFPDKPTHFVEWLSKQTQFLNDDIELLKNSFISRSIYGKYLNELWIETLEIALSKKIHLELFQLEITDLISFETNICIQSCNNEFKVDKVILATGNQLPGNPKELKGDSLLSKRYFQNPWNYKLDSIDTQKPIFIIGNGLTMVDTVIQLREQNRSNKIISLSPHGFHILPHRNFSYTLPDWVSELRQQPTLLELVSAINKQLKSLHKHGISAEPLIDSIRPHTQRFWRGFSYSEKARFMRHFRHLWGLARHRLPFITYDIIQKERIKGTLSIISGYVISTKPVENGIEISYHDNTTKQNQTLIAEALINCTGPESDITKTNSSLLQNCLKKGYIQQDELKLGISANINTFETINSAGKENEKVFAIGNLLRGELWESTAVNELRIQAKNLASAILRN